MKQLLLIRHAKSNMNFWGDDFERPLHPQGEIDAPLMAKKTLARNMSIDAFLSSTAVKAMTTANYFAAAYNKKEQDIIQIDKLYHAEIDTFFEVITAIDNVFNTVAIFSHNPGITDFIRLLTPVRIVSMPPCGVYALKINTDDWTNFKTANKEFLFFDYPKEF